MNPKQRSQPLFRRLLRRYRSTGLDWENESGLTLVECIMALMVIGATGAAIAPMMLVSVATRVQSQKMEQAIELAQSEVDKVRVQFEQRANINPSNPVIPEIITVTGNKAFKHPAPTALSAADTRAVDINDDGRNDFAVQSFLVEDADSANNYEMGVRVYDYDAVANNAASLSKEGTARAGITSSTGERLTKPLAVLYTNLSITEEADSLCNLYDYLDSPDNKKPASCS